MAMNLKPFREERAIVFLGNFNPTIFHPAWFASEGLIRPSEANNASTEVIHPDIAQIDFGGYKLLVTRDRFQIATEQSPFFRMIVDLAQGIFQLLQHTPLHASGYNITEDYLLENERQWHNFGHRLAPKQDIWDPVMEAPGLRPLRVESLHPGGTGHTRVQVSPIEPLSIRLTFTDHFDAPKDTPGKGARELLSIVMENRDGSEAKCQRIFAHLMGIARSNP